MKDQNSGLMSLRGIEQDKEVQGLLDQLIEVVESRYGAKALLFLSNRHQDKESGESEPRTVVMGESNVHLFWEAAHAMLTTAWDAHRASFLLATYFDDGDNTHQIRAMKAQSVAHGFMLQELQRDYVNIMNAKGRGAQDGGGDES